MLGKGDGGAADSRRLASLAASEGIASGTPIFFLERTKSSDCLIRGPYPDPSCTPGALFSEASKDIVCASGYTASVRYVTSGTKKKIYTEYGIAYPKQRGLYEVDHFIPLELGGSNDIANLFPEAATPTLGFHEKDVVEDYLHEEVCGGRIGLAAAQALIAKDWAAVYRSIPPAEVSTIRKKYGIPSE
ncbi:MAG TPA: HNH endonuclease signature motif containing protein [Candidatus Paceibacterota bacterium]|nr:HNH endonuclease signature motif containing protein [Candidatus Paceibacterota bacterium]